MRTKTTFLLATLFVIVAAFVIWLVMMTKQPTAVPVSIAGVPGAGGFNGIYAYGPAPGTTFTSNADLEYIWCVIQGLGTLLLCFVCTLVGPWRPAYYRIFACLVTALWVCALFAPVDEFNIGSGASFLVSDYSVEKGLFLAKWGAIGPLALTVAWYANLFLPFLILRMFSGRPPWLRTTQIACLIAYSALIPHAYFDFELTGRFSSPKIFEGSAVILWLGAFTMSALASTMRFDAHIKISGL